MDQIFFEVQGIGRVQLVQVLGASLLVEDESGTRLSLPASLLVEDESVPRLSLPASRCVQVDQTAAALADQFTGQDMGAEMRAAEFDHMQTVAQVGQRVTSSAGVGRVKWVEPTVCGVVYFVQSEACPDCRPAVCLGDELQLLGA